MSPFYLSFVFAFLGEEVTKVRYEMKDIVAEGSKVWVWGEISANGVSKDSVGMFSYDGDGLLVEMRNLQRIKGSVS